MNDSTKNIVAMIVTNTNLTLYTETGNTIVLTDDGPYDTKKLCEHLTDKLTGKAYLTLNMNDFTKLIPILNSDDYAKEGEIITHVLGGQTIQGVFYPAKTQVSVKLPNQEQPVVLPSLKNLDSQIDRATKENSPSVSNFLKSLAKVISERGHTAEDLLEFIGRCELPLTNDGRIIAYKRVNQHAEGYYVDIHSGKIAQRVGSRVRMEVDMVDPNRHNSCSTGLHVANLGYLSGFWGSHTLIVLVSPENFIAVPEGETDKARVACYDIVAVLDQNSHKVVTSGVHIDGDVNFESIIASIIEGKISEPFEEILVGNKEILSVTPLFYKVDPTPTNPVKEPESKPSKTTGKSLKTDKKKVSDNLKTALKTKGYIKHLPEVKLAFDRLIKAESGEDSKASIARDLATSTRSLGRWQEKYDYEAYKASLVKK